MNINFLFCSTLENYFKWQLARSYVPDLGNDFLSLYYQFHKLVSGEGQQERYLTCIGDIEWVAPMPLARLFTNYILPPGTKDDMSRLITSIKDAFIERVMANEWLDDTTRKRSIWKVSNALTPLKKMYVLVVFSRGLNFTMTGKFDLVETMSP